MDNIVNKIAVDFAWDFSDGVLTVHGNGKMPEFVSEDREVTYPWIGYADRITFAEIREGVTSISSFAFCGCGK